MELKDIFLLSLIKELLKLTKLTQLLGTTNQPPFLNQTKKDQETTLMPNTKFNIITEC
jgi:hypothetical protein